MKLWTVLCSSIIAMSMSQVADAEALVTIGWIEHVKLQNKDLLMKAKIDTGADHSSIHASNIEMYERDNIQMVKFTVENQLGHSAEFNKPLVRIAEIKRKGARSLERPVVNMNLCIGNTLKSVDVNLADRGNFNYRMLIGRSFLVNQYLVNSARQYTSEPNCSTDNVASKSDN